MATPYGTAYFQIYLRNVQKVWAVGALRPDDNLETKQKPVMLGTIQPFEEWCRNNRPAPQKSAA